MTSNHTLTISYGKTHVPVYRVYARPLHGITPIPESPFLKRENVLFACEVDVEVFGTNFLPAYTHGDNSNVVATDSMKNFILRQALTFEGSTLEAFLALLGNGFLQTYPEMQQITLNARELPFHTIPVPQQDGFGESQLLFSRSHGSFATASLNFAYKDGQPVITHHRCGLVAMELFKVTGSSFSRFVRDEYTTLQERVDRPLFIALNVYWKYSDVATALHADTSRYVPVEQVRDLVQVVFHQFVSESIQHLVHEIGLRLLERFPQLAEVSFEARNLTRDQIAASPENEQIKVYSDPFPAYGLIKLNMGRDS